MSLPSGASRWYSIAPSGRGGGPHSRKIREEPLQGNAATSFEDDQLSSPEPRGQEGAERHGVRRGNQPVAQPRLIRRERLDEFADGAEQVGLERHELRGDLGMQ